MSKPSSPIRVGFVGLSATGWAANALAPSLLQESLRDKYALVAVSTTSESSAKASADKYAQQAGRVLKPYHGSSSAIAHDPEVDLVAVSVKSYLHKETVLPVIEAKKPFFLEWPAGRNTAESEEIAAAAKSHGVTSFIGLQGRGSPVVRKVRELVQNGAIGKVQSAVFIASAPGDVHIWSPTVKQSTTYLAAKANGADFLTIAGGHLLDPFTYALGSFKSVSAIGKNQYPTITIVDDSGKPTGETRPAEFFDHYHFSGELDTGVLATVVLRSPYKSTPGRRRLLWEIEGEEGSIRVEGDNPFINTSNPKVYLNGEVVDVEGSDSGLLGILGYAWEQYALGDDGKHAVIDDAVKLHRLLDAIEQSAKEGGKQVPVEH